MTFPSKLYFLFFFFFRLISSKCMTLSRCFFCAKQRHFTLSSAPVLRFFATLKFHEPVQIVTAELYSFICDAILFICTHAHRSLRSETIITEDCWIRKMVCVHGSRGVFFVHCWLGVWTGMANDSSANTAYIYWRSLWGHTLLGDGKLKLKHVPAAKKSDTKKFKNVKMEQDVGKADEQKAWKQDRDDSVKISVYNSTLHISPP